MPRQRTGEPGTDLQVHETSLRHDGPSVRHLRKLTGTSFLIAIRDADQVLFGSFIWHDRLPIRVGVSGRAAEQSGYAAA